MCRNYGDFSRTALQVALRGKSCTQDSLTSYVNAILADRRAPELREDQVVIARATVANWSSGRENMPADALALLLEHVAAATVMWAERRYMRCAPAGGERWIDRMASEAERRMARAERMYPHLFPTPAGTGELPKDPT